jgi:hypothetical protein
MLATIKMYFLTEEFRMNRRNWLVAALVAVPVLVLGGLGYAHSQRTVGYTCPLTGETLPCPNCCPLNQDKAEAPKDAGYVCPMTGETLPCEKCCPLNQK